MGQEQAFWDDVFTKSAAIKEPDGDNLAALQAAQGFFGELRGATVLDLGAGKGESSVFFARLGANVISVDQSEVAMRNLDTYCRHNQIYNLKTVAADLTEIASLGPVDYIFGSMVLHHVEPFEPFVKLIRSVLAPDGRAFFFENNATSNLLIWFRTNLVGKMGIPKYGDPSEFPLSPGEIALLRRYFNVKQEFPFMAFFSLASAYLFRNRFRPVLKALDRGMYRIEGFRKYSYRQHIFVSKLLR